jgi:hypothetical protein
MSVLQDLRSISLIVFTARDLLGTGTGFHLTVVQLYLKVGHFKAHNVSLAKIPMSSVSFTRSKAWEVNLTE